MIATSLSQSRKLAELGIPSNTADMCWSNQSVKGVNYTDKFALVPKTREHIESVFNETFHDWNKYWELIPAWSLSAMLQYLREIDFFPEIQADEVYVTMSIYYYDDEEGTVIHPMHELEVKKDSFVDAVFELICRLKENKCI